MSDLTARKKDMKTLEKLNQLPSETANEIKRVLRAYDECYVTYEYGKFNVSVGITIKAKYGTDYKWIGEFKAEEIYSQEERYQNFKEVFGYEYYGNLKGYDTK